MLSTPPVNMLTFSSFGQQWCREEVKIEYMQQSVQYINLARVHTEIQARIQRISQDLQILENTWPNSLK